MLGALTLLGKGIADLGGKWLTNRRERQKAEHETAMAVEGRRKELAQQKGTNDAAWELAVLAQPPDRPMRRTLALLFLSPVFVTVLWPARGLEVWAALRTVPTEYWVVCGTIFGFYFAAKAAPVFFGKLGQALRRMKPAKAAAKDESPLLPSER